MNFIYYVFPTRTESLLRQASLSVLFTAESLVFGTATGFDLYTHHDLIFSFFCTVKFENQWTRPKGKFVCRQISEYPLIWVFKTTLRSLVVSGKFSGAPTDPWVNGCVCS